MPNDSVHPASAERRLPDHSTLRSRALALAGVFLLALLARSAWLLTGGRLWAEEGTLYYAPLQDAGLGQAVTLVVRGNYQLLANLSAWLAGTVPALWAAHVTTGLALLTGFVVVTQLAQLSLERGWKPWTMLAGIVVLAWMPSGYEIYLTSTNIQWLCSVSVLLLVLLDPAAWGRRAKMGATAWAAACALTGVPPLTMAPLMLWRAWRSRSRPHLVWALLLVAGAAVQVAVILSHSHDDRSFRFDGYVTVLAFMSQVVFAPIMGVQGLQPLLDQAALVGAPAVIFSLLVLGAALLAAALRLAWIQEGARFVGLLASASVLTVVVNTYAALGNQKEFISAWSGGRYFFLAQVCWLLLLVAAANAPRTGYRAGAAALLALGIATGWHESRTGAWKEFIVSGPSWPMTVKDCQDRRPCQVPVWPMAMGWTFELRRP
jgi:hypothetical protein